MMAERYLWIVWDLLALFILFRCIQTSAYRGFLRTLVSFLGYVAAAAAAKLGSPYLANLVYQHLVRDALRLVIVRRLEQFVSQGGAAAEGLLEVLPFGLQKVMNQDAALPWEGGDISQMVEQVIDATLMEPVISLLQGLAFLLLFTLAMLVVRQFAKLFTGVYKIPIIGPINTVLGGLIGVLQGGLCLLIGALAIHLVILMTGGGFFWLGPGVMDDTYIWRVFYLWIGG